MRDNSLRRISDLESQFVNSVRFLTFELARSRLVPKPAPLPRHSVIEQPIKRSTPVAYTVIASSPRHAPPPSSATTIPHSHDARPIGRPAPCVKTPQQEVEKRGEERKERRAETRREQGGEQKQGRKGCPNPSKPPSPSLPLTTEHEQDAPTPPHPVPQPPLTHHPMATLVPGTDRRCFRRRLAVPMQPPPRPHAPAHFPS